MISHIQDLIDERRYHDASALAIHLKLTKETRSLFEKDKFMSTDKKTGFYKNFVSDTITSFWNCGVILYNEMILVNTVGCPAMRVGRQFNSGRKVGKNHQNVLVFYKGNPKNISKNFPKIDLSFINSEFECETEND